MYTDAETLLVDLDSESLIRVSGPDAIAFLQGQLSTDVEKLTSVMSQLSSWNNAKGRVVTLLHLFRRGDDIVLALPSALRASVLKRISMYVLRSKVTLTDAADLTGVGLAGKDAAVLLAETGITPPKDQGAVSEHGRIQAIRLHGSLPRYMLYGDRDALQAKFGSVPRGTEDQWALHKIATAEPTVYAETSEHFVAQMLDLDKLGGIDFKKGCYTGQEVIARAHYRGGVKRHLARALSETAASLRPGMDIHVSGHDVPVAEVVDARLDAQGIWQMLLVIQDDFRNTELTHGGVAVKVLAT